MAHPECLMLAMSGKFIKIKYSLRFYGHINDSQYRRVRSSPLSVHYLSTFHLYQNSRYYTVRKWNITNFLSANEDEAMRNSFFILISDIDKLEKQSGVRRPPALLEIRAFELPRIQFNAQNYSKLAYFRRQTESGSEYLTGAPTLRSSKSKQRSYVWVLRWQVTTVKLPLHDSLSSSPTATIKQIRPWETSYWQWQWIMTVFIVFDWEFYWTSGFIFEWQWFFHG